jgi:hypothetical protein
MCRSLKTEYDLVLTHTHIRAHINAHAYVCTYILAIPGKFNNELVNEFMCVHRCIYTIG